jgi:hypothetical protein
MNRRTKACFLLVAGLLVLSPRGVSAGGEAECFEQLDPSANATGGMTRRRNDVKLQGTAKGGELLLLEMDIPNPRYVKIETQPGEPAEVVLARMAAAVNEGRPFNPFQRANVRAEGSLLKSFPGTPGSYLFAGSETGLGIPPPPTSLSASYDPERQEVSLAWETPENAYDAIGVFGAGSRVQAGTTTSLVRKAPAPQHRQNLARQWERDVDRRDKGLRRFYVVGCRNGVLSNAAVITWDYDDSSQQELDVQPFTGGTSPNWKGWSNGGEPGMLVLEQGTKGEWKRVDQEPKRVLKPDDKRFFQWIKSRSPAVTGGVCRKFLGLKPGHTYRVYTRMNTFDMDGVQEDWSFTFHAVPHGKDVTLTPQQMAGVAPLPGGGQGPTAGLVASYGPGSTTKGKFVECSTEKSGKDSQAADITMPPGAEVITVWFRYNGPASGGVGFDWIKLKDVTTK